jgi:hypothetical protein
MPSYSYYKGKDFSSYQVSLDDFFRYVKYVRQGRPKCNVQGINSKTLLKIAS